MFFKKKTDLISYNSAEKKPVVKASICNGEKVAGFLNLKTGAFEEVMLIQTASDMEEFKSRCGVDGEIEKIY